MARPEWKTLAVFEDELLLATGAGEVVVDAAGAAWSRTWTPEASLRVQAHGLVHLLARATSSSQVVERVDRVAVLAGSRVLLAVKTVFVFAQLDSLGRGVESGLLRQFLQAEARRQVHVEACT
jgi:hypothetical protein